MRVILSIVMLVAIAWCGALGWFVLGIAHNKLPTTTKADAIIVLTGGSGRIEHGLAMLAEGAAPVLFISGVGKNTTEAEILDKNTTQEIREKIYEQGGEIVLDRIARSTVSNADQSANFIRERGIHSIRLVTADYHMKRSLREFRAANPEVEIFADPVFPEAFHRQQWWAHENSRRLMFSEFYKYLAVWARDEIRP